MGHVVCFESVDELKGDSAGAGWNLEYHQLEPGRLRGFIVAGKAGDIRVFAKKANLRIEVLGTPPDGHVTLMCPCAGQTVWTNGYRLGDKDALMLRPGANVHSALGPASIFQAIVPIDLLRKCGASDAHLISGDDRDGAIAVRLAVQDAHALRRQMTDIFIGSEHAADDLEDTLATSVCTLLRQAFEQRNDSAPRCETWRTISRAREYIESNLHRPIRMEHIGDYAAASVSKLERTFKRELCTTPSQYVLARRLHAVRQQLGFASYGRIKIADLAMRFGFRHLGRFSASYRAQFDELPSQTLRAQALQATHAGPSGVSYSRMSRIS